MAGGAAVLAHLDDHRVGIAVGQHLHDILGVAGLFALHPVFVAAAAEKPGLAGFQGQVHRLFVKKGHHQHFVGLIILDHRRNQTAHLIEIDFDHGSPSRLHPWQGVNKTPFSYTAAPQNVNHLHRFWQSERVCNPGLSQGNLQYVSQSGGWEG
jgi:hypothetical protein